MVCLLIYQVVVSIFEASSKLTLYFLRWKYVYFLQTSIIHFFSQYFDCSKLFFWQNADFCLFFTKECFWIFFQLAQKIFLWIQAFCSLVPSATIRCIAATSTLSWPWVFMLTSFYPILVIVFVLFIFINKGVSSIFAIWVRLK